MTYTIRTAAPMAAAVMLLVATSGCLDWNASRLERDGRAEQGVDADAAGDMPKDMPGDADAGDSTRDADGGDSTRDADGMPGEGGVETSQDASDAAPDVTADGPTLDGDLGALRGSGTACATNAQCLSGWCTGGVCCNQPCTGSCYSCSTTGNIGICRPVANGELPPSGKQCAVGAGCGRDGRCDGAGHCRSKPAGSVCQSGVCSSSTQFTVAKICNGLGNCLQAPVGQNINCGLYRCNNLGCRAPCPNPGGCNGGCSAGQCGGTLFPLGGNCTQNSDCASGKCVDDVCCESDCAGPCKTCKLPGLRGRCIDTPLGMPARPGGCTAGATPCVNDGTCDGAGACRTTPAGTRCGLTTCSGGALRVSECDGNGACVTTSTSCGDFKCQSGLPSCYGRCDSPSQCVTNNCNTTTRTCQ